MDFTTRLFQAAVRHQPGVGIIDLKGELGAGATIPLQEAFMSALEKHPACVVLNFTDVVYINSRGVAQIVGLIRQGQQRHRSLIVYGLSSYFRELFALTKLDTFVTIMPDEEATLSYIRQEQGRTF